MKILAIETSCDETAVTILEATGSEENALFTVLGDALYSQASKHAAFGGVYPTLAKREHAANLVPLLTDALTQAGEYATTTETLSTEQQTVLQQLLAREEELFPAVVHFFSAVARPHIDAIAVTYGPGLEPALWVGINFARALATIWDLPIIPVNHLEGHIVASAVTRTPDNMHHYHMNAVTFPTLSLVLSGGHTEFIYATAWGSYHVVGQTRDDSVGEAFDKVARLLGIPYPGGHGLSLLAEKQRRLMATHPAGHHTHTLPRPMARAENLDFSFSGLKTAVLYWVRDLGELTDAQRAEIALEFEEAVVDVLIAKTARALDSYPVHAFLLGGGVSANVYIRNRLTQFFVHEGIDLPLHLPAEGLSTDNAVMIGMAGYLIHLRGAPTQLGSDDLRARGSLRIGGTEDTA